MQYCTSGSHRMETAKDLRETNTKTAPLVAHTEQPTLRRDDSWQLAFSMVAPGGPPRLTEGDGSGAKATCRHSGDG